MTLIMRRALLFIYLLVVGAITQARACSCVGTSTVASELKRSDFVVVGRITARTRISAATFLKGVKDLPSFSANDTSFFFYRYKYTVEVEEVYKGNQQEKVVEIFTGAGGGDCGIEFLVGSTYIIYARLQRTFVANLGGKELETNPFLTTDVCTRTTRKNETELAALQKAAPH
jgi:hypothetical protein